MRARTINVWMRFWLGMLATAIVMAFVIAGLLAGFEWFGYPDPRTAPAALRYTALLLGILLIVLVMGFTTGRSYRILQERRSGEGRE